MKQRNHSNYRHDLSPFVTMYMLKWKRDVPIIFGVVRKAVNLLFMWMPSLVK